MITNEERQEVVAKLRNTLLTEGASQYAIDHNCDEYYAVTVAVFRNLFHALGFDESCCSIHDVAIRLADLIKPAESKQTCQIKNTCFDEFAIYDYLTCGHVNLRHHHEPTSYCSTCGAKVVRE